MSENAWFKHWAKKSISSADLNSLTDHEERVWWRFLAVASSQEERWVVRLSVKLTIEALAYSCHSTNPKLKAALTRFEAMGMLTAIDGGWVVTNWEKHQETPEAKRKREQRERDKARDTRRDMSHDKSRDSHSQEDRGQRTESSEPKGSSGGGRKRRAIQPDDVSRWEGEYPAVDIPAMVADYLNWSGSSKHHDKVLGFQNQLRDQWRLEKFAKKAPERRYNREEGIFAGID